MGLTVGPRSNAVAEQLKGKQRQGSSDLRHVPVVRGAKLGLRRCRMVVPASLALGMMLTYMITTDVSEADRLRGWCPCSSIDARLKLFRDCDWLTARVS